VEILGQRFLSAREEHASLLLPRAEGLLKEVGGTVGELSGIVVGAGPGSFTGVRVAAATGKGLAWSLGIPMWAFSSLAAAASTVDAESVRPRMVLFDARGDRLYAAAFRFGPSSVETLLAPCATTVDRLLDEQIPPGSLLMGDGAVRHRSLLEGAGHLVLEPPVGIPAAGGLLHLLSVDPPAEPLKDPGPWEPEYLRRSGAERVRKAREGQWNP